MNKYALDIYRDMNGEEIEPCGIDRPAAGTFK